MLDAAIIDVDGVLTRTAVLHERAWKAALDPVLQRGREARPFTRDDYLRYVDGKPRADGLRDVLASRGLTLGEAELEDLATHKNALFQDLLTREGVQVYEDVAQLRTWRRHGLGLAFVSASRNARRVLESARLLTLCDVFIDGEIAAAQGLCDKNQMFLAAAHRLDVEPARAMVAEDSESGVAAAVQGGFGLVVGVSRENDGANLVAAGAHRVVRRLDEITGVVEPGTQRASELPSALDHDLLDTSLGGRHPAVFLDYDGTLTPIVDTPDQAALEKATCEVLRDLAKRCLVAVVSGRALDDVAKRIGVDGLWYVGSHGFEIRAPDGRTYPLESARAAVPALAAAEETLRRELGSLPGILFERKPFGLAVHYRLASDPDTALATRRVREIARTVGHLRAHVDLKVIELRPDVDWDKGKAIDRLIDVLGAQEAVPVYLGDGHTDEDAFRSLRERGLAVIVGAPLRPTHAEARVADPGEVRELLARLSTWIQHHEGDSWRMIFQGWVPERQGLREALCTVGNGTFATRGAAEEAVADGVHYPGTYLAGGYDRIATEVHGEVLVNEDLVNWPNWLPLTFRPVGGEWLSFETYEVLDLEQALDLRAALLTRRLRVRDRAGRVTRIESRRFASMDDPYLAALHWRLVPEGWSGRIEVRSTLDGTVRNAGVARYADLRGDHLVPEGTGHLGEAMWLATRSRQSRIRMAQVARTRVLPVDAVVSRAMDEHLDRISVILGLEARAGEALEIEKVVAIHGSRDPATSDPVEDARERVDGVPEFGTLALRHARRWRQLWHRCDIWLGEGHEEANRILRLHMFHLLQVASPHVADRDIGVPARGLHGEAYRGHVFWDELFIFPFLDYSLPELTRELLMYRYRRLDPARWIARSLGHVGACYPWQSGSTGREETQVMHLNPKSGRWVPDETSRQRHIGLAIAWNVWQYFEATGDHEFLSGFGAEMVLEIARFFASLAEWHPALERYCIRGVVGPDEFHVRHPGSVRPGLDDNAYTNILAAWCLRTAERVLDEIGEDRRRELLAELQISGEERARWRDVASRLRVVFHDERVISQFDGYASLQELDWDAYRKKYGDIHRLDRILEAEGDSVDRYKVSKQADVLMLFYLFPSAELIELLRSMGYPFETSWITDNVEYYLQRTSDGSTLSAVVHSWVLARLDRKRSWSLFGRALRADLEDVQGGTTPEGIHLGAMAGTVDLVKRGLTGARVRDGVLWLGPRLPDELPELRTRFRVRAAWFDVRVTQKRLDVTYTSGRTAHERVGFAGRIYELARGETRTFDLGAAGPPATDVRPVEELRPS